MLYLRNYQKYWYPILRVQLTPIFEHVWLLGPIMSKIDSQGNKISDHAEK